MPFLVFVLDPSLALALVLLTASGLCGAYLLGLDQLLLDVTPPDLLGRAYTVNTSVLMATQGIGFAGAGALGGGRTARPGDRRGRARGAW